MYMISYIKVIVNLAIFIKLEDLWIIFNLNFNYKAYNKIVRLCKVVLECIII